MGAAMASACDAAPPADKDVEHCCATSDNDALSCRICFEDVAKPSELISPCKCKGTLRYVHPACLAKWQSNVLRLGQAGDERAYICSVCRTPYSVAPLRPSLWRSCASGVCSLAGCMSIGMLAFGLSGPPLLHVALLLLMLLSMRLQSVASVLLLTGSALLVALYARSLAAGVRAGQGQYRSGAMAVEGLGPGALLVASRELSHTMFEKSVVLLYEHSARGAKGVLLTQPMDVVDQQLWRQPPLADQQASAAHIQHFMGGPVGMPQQGSPASQTFMLHHMAALPGAAQLLPPLLSEIEPNGSSPSRLFAHHGAARAAAWHLRRRQQQQERQQHELAPSLHHGGSLGELLAALQAKQQGTQASASIAQQQQAQLQRVRVFHGVCGWAGGQLEAELMSGAWGLAQANPADITVTSPQQLWQQLSNGRRLRWL